MIETTGYLIRENDKIKRESKNLDEELETRINAVETMEL